MPHITSRPTRNDGRPLRGTLLVAAIATSVAMAPCAGVASGMIAPTIAVADELEDLVNEVSDVRRQLEETKSAYLEAVRQQAEAASAADVARGELSSIQERLDGHQSELARVVKAQYKTSSDMRLLNLITSSESMVGLTESMDYLGHVEDKKVISASAVLDLRNEQAEAVRLLEETEASANEAASAAEARQSELEARKEELRPRIDSLMGEVKARLNGSAGNTQLEEALSFLEGVQGIGETQADIVRCAYSTGYAGYSMCEAWAERVYYRAGVPMGNFGSAYSAYSAYFISDDWDEMPVGALCFGSGTSGPYSHVGICVFNGGGGADTIYVMDNEGSRQGKAVTLTEWLKWQTAVSWNNGQVGWFGWGYPEGADLE